MESSNHKPVGLTKWQRMRGKENVHSSTAIPTGLGYTCVCACVHSCQCVFRYCVYVCICVCVCHVNTAQWLVREVTDSFIMACAHRETAPSRGRREEDRDMGRARFTAGPSHVSLEVGGGKWGGSRSLGGKLLSSLMSLCFFHQLSIYRAVQHSCHAPLIPSTHIQPSYHTHTHSHGSRLSCFSQVIHTSSLFIVKLICCLPLIRPISPGKAVTQGSSVTNAGLFLSILQQWRCLNQPQQDIDVHIQHTADMEN